MVIQLTPKLEACVEEILTAGHFSSAEEVVDAALKLLADREQRLQELDAILTAAEHEVAEGRFVRYDSGYIERLKHEAAENSRLGKLIDNDRIG